MSSIRKHTWKVGDIDRCAWVCDYHDQTGVRRLRTFATKAAEAWAVTALHEVSQGVHSSASQSSENGRESEGTLREGIDFPSRAEIKLQSPPP